MNDGPNRLVFVVGASRSGTTMLNRMLGVHPQVSASNELHFFGEAGAVGTVLGSRSDPRVKRAAALLVARHSRGIWGGAPSEADRKQAHQLLESLGPTEITAGDVFEAFTKRVAEEEGVTYVTDQTPRNIFYGRDLLARFSNAYIIQVVRDPRGVLASQKNRWKRRKLGGRGIPLRETVRVWVNYHPKLMSHLWANAYDAGKALENNERYLRLKFEDLVSNPGKELQRVCEFLDIRYLAEMERVPKVGSSNRTNEDSSLGVERSVIDRWREILTKDEVAVCEAVAGARMAEEGYEVVGEKLSLHDQLTQSLLFALKVAVIPLVDPRRALVLARANLPRRRA